MAPNAEGSNVADGSERIAGDDRPGDRFAWLALFLGGWVVGGVVLVARALNLGLTDDVGVSPYHLVGYLAVVALLVACLTRVVRAVRSGRSWRAAFPRHHGTLGAGLVALLAYIVLDVAWREGVGIADGIEGGFAPSRILLVAGLILVVVGPFRAAVLDADRRSPIWPAVVAAGLCLAVLSLPGGYHPAANPWMEQVSGVTQDDSEIWLMDADGGHQTRLIEAVDGYELSYPAWSPDGEQLAYSRWLGFRGNEVGDVDVWAAAADGSGARALAAGDGWQWLPRWSPDGSTVAFTNEVQGGPWLATGPVGRATGFGPLGPGFEVAGTRSGTAADLWRVAVDGSGDPRPIAEMPGDDRSGSWSPGSDRLAFDTTRDGNTEIYVVAADGSGPARLTDDPAEDWAPAWSPDGSRIAFSSDRTGVAQVFVMDADGGDVRQLTDDPAGSQAPAWAPDGERIAFQSWRGGEADVWSMAVDGSDPRNLSRSQSTIDAVWDGSWGPDGRIVFSRGAAEPAFAQGWVREEIGVPTLLIQAVATALVALLLVGLRPPFGSFAIVMAISTALVSAQVDEWRFLPAAIAGGLLVDVAVRLSPPRHVRHIAAATAAAIAVVTAGVTAVATTGLGWSPTLLIGLALAAGLVGWGLAGLVRPRSDRQDPVPPG